MDWDLPVIVLDTRPYGEGDVIATVMTSEHGAHRGLVRGGASRSQGGLWQAGNFVQARWSARMSDQLGHLRGELIHATASSVMDDALPLAMLTAICAQAEDALPEREPHETVFAGMIALLPRLTLGETVLPELIMWETVLLADLGFGLDLTSCAVTGATEGLAYVSPKSGRAVTSGGAGEWTGRLLRLPPFLTGGADRGPEDWRDGLRLTGHFLTRDVFGGRHRPLPMARQMLYDRVAALAADSLPPAAGTPSDDDLSGPEGSGPEGSGPEESRPEEQEPGKNGAGISLGHLEDRDAG
jgi:DNA repair protein RecO (recombination protein O)